MTLPVNTIICGDCLSVMADWPDNCVDLVVTSPPYDEMRDYQGYVFEFEHIAKQLCRVIKSGAVIVWIVADQTRNGSETGTSFRQALYFMELGLGLHDTMIYHRQAANPCLTRYWQNFEFMFIFSKGRPKTTNLLRDRKNKYRRMGGDNVRQKDGSLVSGARGGISFGEYGIRENIWYYGVGKGVSSSEPIAFQHPAIFPEKLAADHIKSWSNEEDLVLDPMNGSGTTTKMAAILKRRYIGIDISGEYCEIARQRIRAVDTGVPVTEQVAGQMPLFRGEDG